MPVIKDESIDNRTIIEFVKHVRNKYYPDMDISFMELFMNMVGVDDFIVCSDELAKYGILSIKSDRKVIDITHVKRLLDDNILNENIDFKVVPLQRDNPNGGPSTRNIYMLTPYAFKVCLINSTKQPKYKRYYLLLEECIKYYVKNLIDYMKIIKNYMKIIK